METKVETLVENNSRNKINWKGLLSNYGTILVLLLMVVAMSFISPNFLKTGNLVNIVRQITMYAIIGFGVTFIIITGGIDLSSGSLVALSSMILGSLVIKFGWPWPLAILACMAAGAVVGSINGFFVAYTKIPAFVATLGMMLSLKGVTLFVSDKPLHGFSDDFLFIGKGSWLGLPVLIYILIIVGLLSHYLLKHTKFGRYVYSIGGNADAARVSGINIEKTLVIAYAYASTLAALTGVLLSSRVMTAQPTSGTGYEMDAIAGVVIGGTSLAGGVGTIWGTIVGALIIGVLNNALDLMLVNAYMQQVLKGVVIVAAVVLDTLRHRHQ